MRRIAQPIADPYRHQFLRFSEDNLRERAECRERNRINNSLPVCKAGDTRTGCLRGSGSNRRHVADFVTTRSQQQMHLFPENTRAAGRYTRSLAGRRANRSSLARRRARIRLQQTTEPPIPKRIVRGTVCGRLMLKENRSFFADCPESLKTGAHQFVKRDAIQRKKRSIAAFGSPLSAFRPTSKPRILYRHTDLSLNTVFGSPLTLSQSLATSSTTRTPSCRLEWRCPTRARSIMKAHWFCHRPPEWPGLERGTEGWYGGLKGECRYSHPGITDFRLRSLIEWSVHTAAFHPSHI